MLDCKQTANLLRGWDHILVLSHASPDGDTLGSAAALLRALSSMGKAVSFACADPVPEKFAFLFAGVSLEDPAACEHVMTVDVADSKLLDELEEPYGGRIELAIDHHASHRGFAQQAWVSAESAAAAEMIWQLVAELGVAVTKEIADCIYTGICTDTGCFRYRNVTANTLQIAAETLHLGASAGDINQSMFETKSRAQLTAEQQVLANMQYFCDGKCALITLPYALYEQTGAQEEDLEGLPSLPRQVEGVLLGLTVKEKQDGSVKASVRANPPANAAKVCEKFGGGGHAGAAGCAFENCTLEQAVNLLKAACEEYLEEIKAI